MLDAEPLLQPKSFTMARKKTEKEYQRPKAALKVTNPTATTTHP
jgi:hypothetical protein